MFLKILTKQYTDARTHDRHMCGGPSSQRRGAASVASTPGMWMEPRRARLSSTCHSGSRRCWGGGLLSDARVLQPLCTPAMVRSTARHHPHQTLSSSKIPFTNALIYRTKQEPVKPHVLSAPPSFPGEFLKPLR